MAKAMQTRPLGYLTKPFETQALRTVLEAALQQAAGHCRPPVADNVMAVTPHVALQLRDS